MDKIEKRIRFSKWGKVPAWRMAELLNLTQGGIDYTGLSKKELKQSAIKLLLNKEDVKVYHPLIIERFCDYMDEMQKTLEEADSQTRLIVRKFKFLKNEMRLKSEIKKGLHK